MPMLTVYTGDPSLRMRCNETRTFALTPDPTMSWSNKRAYTEGGMLPYHRLEYYGLKGGYHRIYGILLQSTHFMTELIGHVAYFINSI